MRKTRAGRWELSACLSSLALLAASASAGISLPQADGSTLVLDKPAERIIALAPNVAEILYAAGAGARLVATVEYSDYPPAAADLPRIGDAFRFDLEQILTYKPDLVIGWQSGNPDAAMAALEDLGLRMWRTEIRDPRDIARLVELAGAAAGTADTANVEAQRVRRKLAGLTADNSNKAPVSYFYQVAERPLYTVNGKHLISQGLSICGGVNIFHDLPALAPQISPEAVLLADPDALIAPRLQDQIDPLSQWQAWPRLHAVQTGQLVYLPADQISRATPRMLDSIELACKLLDGFRKAQP